MQIKCYHLRSQQNNSQHLLELRIDSGDNATAVPDHLHFAGAGAQDGGGCSSVR